MMYAWPSGEWGSIPIEGGEASPCRVVAFLDELHAAAAITSDATTTVSFQILCTMRPFVDWSGRRYPLAG